MVLVTFMSATLLVLIGIVGYTTGTPNEVTGEVSKTALIPAGIGGVLALCGALATLSPGMRKHGMHAASMVGLLGAAGGLMPLWRQYSKTGDFDPLKPSAVSGELMILVCLGFVGLCVNSFVQARVLRKAAPATEATPPLS